MSSYDGSCSVSTRAISSRLRQYMAIHDVPSDCSRRPSIGRAAAVDGPDVVEAEEAALEHVVAGRVLAVHPPREVQEELVEDALEEVEVGGAADLEDPQGGPGVDRRVDVAEVPLVGGELAVGVHVPL